MNGCERVPIKLSFNSNAFIQDLKEYLLSIMDSINKQFYNSIENGMGMLGKGDSEIEKSVIENRSDHDAPPDGGIEFINARCRFYTNAIMDSFGTGSKMDTSNKYWDEYAMGSMYNPSRSKQVGTPIVGRPQGSYKDIYGNDRFSTGKKSGYIIEGGRNSYGSKIEAIHPSGAIQKQEAWVMQNGETWIERRIELEIMTFISENASKYFYTVGI